MIHTVLEPSVSAGLKEDRPPIADYLWDACQPYGNIYRMWGVDKLHHVDLGVAKRCGLDRLKVSSLDIPPHHTTTAQTLLAGDLLTCDWQLLHAFQDEHECSAGNANSHCRI